MPGRRMTNDELAEVYHRYHDMVYRIALVQTRQQTLAEDIQQEVFLALVRHSDRIRDGEHLKAWLIRVTQNACRKHFRSFWVRRTVPYDDALAKEDPDGGGPPLPEEAAQDAEAEEEETEIVREAVEELPPDRRIVVHLFYYEEMPVREIARSLGITESSAKTRLSRARDQLREILKRRNE